MEYGAYNKPNHLSNIWLKQLKQIKGEKRNE